VEQQRQQKSPSYSSVQPCSSGRPPDPAEACPEGRCTAWRSRTTSRCRRRGPVPDARRAAPGPAGHPLPLPQPTDPGQVLPDHRDIRRPGRERRGADPGLHLVGLKPLQLPGRPGHTNHLRLLVLDPLHLGILGRTLPLGEPPPVPDHPRVPSAIRSASRSWSKAPVPGPRGRRSMPWRSSCQPCSSGDRAGSGRGLPGGAAYTRTGLPHSLRRSSDSSSFCTTSTSQPVLHLVIETARPSAPLSGSGAGHPPPQLFGGIQRSPAHPYRGPSPAGWIRPISSAMSSSGLSNWVPAHSGGPSRISANSIPRCYCGPSQLEGRRSIPRWPCCDRPSLGCCPGPQGPGCWGESAWDQSGSSPPPPSSSPPWPSPAAAPPAPTRPPHRHPQPPLLGPHDPANHPLHRWVGRDHPHHPGHPGQGQLRPLPNQGPGRISGHPLLPRLRALRTSRGSL